MSDSSETPHLRLASLPRHEPTAVDYRPDEGTRKRLLAELDLSALRKARLTGRLIPEGRRNWRLEASLGATIVQPCGLTLEPVTTRIDVPVERLYLADYAGLTDPESEVPEDDSSEPLPDSLDLSALFTEALALETPPFPRADGAVVDSVQAAPEGAVPLTDEALRPFAALAALRKPDTK